MADYSVPLTEFIKELKLTPVYLPDNLEDYKVSTDEVNRSGLLLTGFTEHLVAERIQVCGMAEMSYLNSLSELERSRAINNLFRFKPPAVVFSRNLEIYDEMLSTAQHYKVPILTTPITTSKFISDAISYMGLQLAPRITRHGVLVEVYGEGILITGESGIGKSETAIELVKRGHRFIADDAVELRKVDNSTIVGSAPDNIRHFVEIRGIGIINVRRIFGMGSVNISQRVDLVVHLEHWVNGKSYTRVGIDDEFTSILGVDIPSATIPVQPGRNLAIIIEVAAMNNRQKAMGYNAGRELLQQLGVEE